MNIDSLIEKLTPDAAERLATQLLFLGRPWEEANRELTERNTRQAKRLEELEAAKDKAERLLLQTENTLRDYRDKAEILGDALKAQARKFHCPKEGDKVRVLVDKSRTNYGDKTPAKGDVLTVQYPMVWTAPDGDQQLAALKCTDERVAWWSYLMEEVEPA